MAIIDFYDRGWGINPTGVAYIQDDRFYTFDEVGELSCRIANRLLELGLPKATKGAIWASWSGALDRTRHPTFFLKALPSSAV